MATCISTAISEPITPITIYNIVPHHMVQLVPSSRPHGGKLVPETAWNNMLEWARQVALETS